LAHCRHHRWQRRDSSRRHRTDSQVNDLGPPFVAHCTKSHSVRRRVNPKRRTVSRNSGIR
jgi:hypothetical protein